jgi:hypothetical protein
MNINVNKIIAINMKAIHLRSSITMKRAIIVVLTKKIRNNNINTNAVNKYYPAMGTR